MYKMFFKRTFDFSFSLALIIALAPAMAFLSLIGAVIMRGNPFFIQKRPGKKNEKIGEEKIFSIVKFRTMTNQKDENGRLLPDKKRLIPYGRFLRNTSLDELPELFNILKGDMSFVGPRPLLTEYLDRYSSDERRRHDVKPGLTGYAQAYGRNSLSWEERFEKDIFYVDNCSLALDIKIILKTVAVVLKREGISSVSSVTMENFKGSAKREESYV